MPNPCALVILAPWHSHQDWNTKQDMNAWVGVNREPVAHHILVGIYSGMGSSMFLCLLLDITM